jgi:hypothetical protein
MISSGMAPTVYDVNDEAVGSRCPGHPQTDAELTAPFHRVDRIHKEIQKELLEKIDIPENWWQETFKFGAHSYPLFLQLRSQER